MGRSLDECIKPEQPSPTRQVLGIVLGSGGARGFAHLGVLSELEASDVRPNVLAGASIGALIGAFYAAGWNADEIRALALERAILRSVRLTPSGRGLVRLNHLGRFLRSVLGDLQFRDLTLPFAVTAYDLSRRERIMLQEGPVVPAVLASMAVAVLIEPMRRGNRWLCDPGVVDGLPADVPFLLGATLVLAVSAELAPAEQRWDPTQPPLSELFSLGSRVARLAGRVGFPPLTLALADFLEIKRAALPKTVYSGRVILIQPAYHGMNPNAFHRVDNAIRAGQTAAQSARPEILRALGRPTRAESKVPGGRPPAGTALPTRPYHRSAGTAVPGLSDPPEG